MVNITLMLSWFRSVPSRIADRLFSKASSP